MSFYFNGNTPKKILYNGLNVAKLVYNGVVVWISKVLATISGILPLTLTDCTGDDLVDYKIYGKSEHEELPDEYQQVEYIESTGTQYIDTGFKPNQDTKIDIKITRIAGGISNPAILGVTNPFYSFAINNNDFYYAFNQTGTNIKSTTFSIGETAIFKTDREKLYKNGNLVNTLYTQGNFQSNLNLTLFARRTGNNTAERRGNMQIYYCKIYDNNVLVRNFIPCKNPSNVAGMYDTVNGVFYTNAGTGTFNTGLVISKKSVGDLVTDTSDINYGKYKIPVLTNSNTTNIYLNKPLRKTSKLPTGYTELEHIRGTGTQWIDTGFKPTGNTKVKIKVQLPTQLNVQQGIFGARPGDTGRFTVFTGNRIDALQVDYNTDSSLANYMSVISNFNATNVNEIEMSNKLIINDVLVREVNKISFQSSVNLYLFTNNNNGTPQLRMEGTIWYCKIWDNDVLVRNFIPCKNPSNVIGMYDTVNDVFYSNAGSGSFIAGAEVETVYYTDYLDYENQKVVRNVDDNDEGLDTPIEESVVLPVVPTDEGTTVFDVDTDVTPSYAEVKYYTKPIIENKTLKTSDNLVFVTSDNKIFKLKEEE